MADVNFTVNLTFTAIDKSLNKTFENLEKVGVKATKDINKNLENTNKEIDKAKGGFNDIDLSFLSLMFGGMALERMFKGLFNTVVDSYRKMSDENSLFNKQVTRLSNAFEFLKYTFGRAFAESPFVQAVIDKLVITLNNISSWAEDNPELAGFLIDVAGGLAAIGTSLVLLGTAKQLFGMGGTFPTLVKDLTNLGNALKDGALANDLYNISHILRGDGFGVKGGFIWAVTQFAIQHPIIAAVVALLAIMAAIFLSQPEAIKDVGDTWTGYVLPSLERSVNEILNMVGFSVDLEDTWLFIGFLFGWILKLVGLLLSLVGIGLVGAVASIKVAILEIGKFLYSAIISPITDFLNSLRAIAVWAKADWLVASIDAANALVQTPADVLDEASNKTIQNFREFMENQYPNFASQVEGLSFESFNENFNEAKNKREAAEAEKEITAEKEKQLNIEREIYNLNTDRLVQTQRSLADQLTYTPTAN